MEICYHKENIIKSVEPFLTASSITWLSKPFAKPYDDLMISPFSIYTIFPFSSNYEIQLIIPRCPILPEPQLGACGIILLLPHFEQPAKITPCNSIIHF